MARINGTLSVKEFVEGARLFAKISAKFGENWHITEENPMEDEGVYLKMRTVLPISLPMTSQSRDVSNVQSQNDVSELSECDTLGGDVTNILEDDDAAIIPEMTSQNFTMNQSEQSKEICTFEYHIVYSSSYQVPVLYFNVYKQNGALLTLDEIWSQVPGYYQSRLHEERWTFITQQEHPSLGRPFFQLHPCYTEKFMGSVKTMYHNTQPSTNSAEKNVEKTIGKNAEYFEETESESVQKMDSLISVEGLLSDAYLAEAGVGCRYVVTWLSAVGPVVKLQLPMQYAQLTF